MQTIASDLDSYSASQFRVMPTTSGHAMLLSAEEFPIYHLHITRFLTEFRPFDQWESDLVQRIADNEWRMDRIARLEMGLYALGQLTFADLYPNEEEHVRSLLIQTHTHAVYARQLSNLGVQEARLRRYVEKDLLDLRKRQSERLERDGEKKALTSAATASQGNQRSADPHSAEQNGFEFSDALSSDVKRSQPTSTSPVNGKITRH